VTSIPVRCTVETDPVNYRDPKGLYRCEFVSTVTGLPDEHTSAEVKSKRSSPTVEEAACAASDRAPLHLRRMRLNWCRSNRCNSGPYLCRNGESAMKRLRRAIRRKMDTNCRSCLGWPSTRTLAELHITYFAWLWRTPRISQVAFRC
jgi:hypothetical protein